MKVEFPLSQTAPPCTVALLLYAGEKEVTVPLLPMVTGPVCANSLAPLSNKSGLLLDPPLAEPLPTRNVLATVIEAELEITSALPKLFELFPIAIVAVLFQNTFGPLSTSTPCPPAPLARTVVAAVTMPLVTISVPPPLLPITARPGTTNPFPEMVEEAR